MNNELKINELGTVSGGVKVHFNEEALFSDYSVLGNTIAFGMTMADARRLKSQMPTPCETSVALT